MRNAFTLIELLVVIAILAVLAVVVVLTLNPAGLLQEARDANRISDMATINNALGLSLADSSSESLGSANTVYVSVPDPTATTTAGDQCQGLGLLVLPSGWSYQCAASSTYRKTDDTGWIPVNLSANTFGSSMVQLPIDPVDTTSSRHYYTYETDGSGHYETTAAFESAKYRLGGTSDQISGDGGTLASVYEKGSRLGMEPLDYGDSSLVGLWTFDEGTGGTVYDYSGSNATGSWNGTGAHWAAGRIGSYAGQFATTTSDYVNTGGNPAPLRIIGNALTEVSCVYPQDGTDLQFITAKSGAYQLILGGGYVGAYQYGTTPPGYQYSTNPVSLNAWTQVAYVYNGSNITFYVNGVPNGSTSKTGTITDSGSATMIGWDGFGGHVSFSGLIDDVRVYSRALSSAEIAALYAGGK